MSTTNHNILYFVDIPGIRFLNMDVFLWKASNALVGRGLCGTFASNLVHPTVRRQLGFI
jgi:hypothetical protein